MRLPYERFLDSKRSKLALLKLYVLCYKFHTQVVQVYLQPIRRNLLLKCAPQLKVEKNHQKNIFWKFKVDTIKKLVNSACYDKQHVYAYLQLFSH